MYLVIHPGVSLLLDCFRFLYLCMYPIPSLCCKFFIYLVFVFFIDSCMSSFMCLISYVFLSFSFMHVFISFVLSFGSYFFCSYCLMWPRWLFRCVLYFFRYVCVRYFFIYVFRPLVRSFFIYLVVSYVYLFRCGLDVFS